MKTAGWVLFFSIVLAQSGWAEPVRLDATITGETGPLAGTVDLNKDGNPDRWRYSLRDGSVLKIERDIDYDGVVDTRRWTFFRDKSQEHIEKIVYADVATGKVGRVDSYDKLGFLARIQLATNDDELVDVDILCHGNQLDSAEVDFNGDGVSDFNLTFDNSNFVKAELKTSDAAGFDLEDIEAVKQWWSTHYPRQFAAAAKVAKRFFKDKE
ncbi:MAG: hypothetical protein HGA80_06055 [Candidatus Omnitrophica bacterium]|nr:hypothetical protein [Candidatus Omnitrophota bacterium]